MIAPVHAAKAATAAKKTEDLGALPEWNLNDLYPGMESGDFKADLAKAEEETKAFEAKYRGKLDELVRGAKGGDKLAEAVRAFEAIEERVGRIMSYAGLIHAGDTSDPVRAKFYGDAQDKMTTASSRLLFFTLELNNLV
jgi:oligoendopeptidase F